MVQDLYGHKAESCSGRRMQRRPRSGCAYVTRKDPSKIPPKRDRDMAPGSSAVRARGEGRMWVVRFLVFVA